MTRTALIAVALLCATSARAAEPPPATLILPTGVVGAVREYLVQRPYAEVAPLIGAIEGCVRIQVPVNGVTRSIGECPDVMAAMQSRDTGKPGAVPPKTDQPIPPATPSKPEAPEPAPVR